MFLCDGFSPVTQLSTGHKNGEELKWFLFPAKFPFFTFPMIPLITRTVIVNHRWYFQHYLLISGDNHHTLMGSAGTQNSQWLVVMLVAVLVSASKRTAPWCLTGPFSMEHRNYSFSFVLTGHSFCRSSVNVALMKKYGSSLCPCSPHRVPFADNLPRPSPGPLHPSAPHPRPLWLPPLLY